MESGDLGPTSREKRDLVCVVPFHVPMTCSKAGCIEGLSDDALSEWVGSEEHSVKPTDFRGFPQPLLQLCKCQCQLRGPPVRKPLFIRRPLCIRVTELRHQTQGGMRQCPALREPTVLATRTGDASSGQASSRQTRPHIRTLGGILSDSKGCC